MWNEIMSKRLEKPKLENKKYLGLTIIAAIIIVSLFAVYQFSDSFDSETRPEGVGEIGSEHVHTKVSVILDWQWLSLEASEYSRYANANDYIFMQPREPYNLVHRHATGATLGLFFDSLGMKYSGDCFTLTEGGFNPDTDEPFERTEFCTDGDNILKLYVNGKLNEVNENYIIQDNDSVLIVYDNSTKTEKSYA